MTKNKNMIPCNQTIAITEIQTNLSNLATSVHELKEMKHQEHEDIKEMAQLKLTAIHGEMMAKNDAVLGEMKIYHEKQMAALHETITLQKITNSRVTHLEEKNVTIDNDIAYIKHQGRFVIWANAHPKTFWGLLLLVSIILSYIAQVVSMEQIIKILMK